MGAISSNGRSNMSCSTKVLNIALINFWNRVNVTIRQVSGVMPKAVQREIVRARPFS